MIEKQKIEALAVKYQRAREGIRLSSKEQKNYESNIKNKTDLDQVSNVKIVL